MIFLEKISELLSSADIGSSTEAPHAVLIGGCDVLSDHAKHIVFEPMTEGLLMHLCQSYTRNLPEELLAIYSKMNGADLFWTTRYVQKAKLYIPFCMFSIYGVPWLDSRKYLEPFNISIEDLHRPKDTPKSWLKFGSYYEPKTYSHKRDLYVDTGEKYVYAVEHDSTDCFVIQRWASIDSCLCDVFDLLKSVYG